MMKIQVEVLAPTAVVGDIAFQLPGREEFAKRAADIGDSLVEVASTFRERLDKGFEGHENGTWALEGLELKFSIDLEAETGVVIARASTKAGFEATLTWKRQK